MKKTDVQHPSQSRIGCVDLFCGAGGLSYGLARAGVEVTAGVDLDPDCSFPYEANNHGRFILRDVGKLTGKELKKFYPNAPIKLLAGCAPCQPFSTYSQGRDARRNPDWRLLSEFGRLVRELNPELVTMENVPQLRGHAIFHEFLKSLSGFDVWYDVVDCAEYGMPQSRRRLVLLASKLGPVALALPRKKSNQRPSTVRETIGRLPALESGQQDAKDPIHIASKLTEINLKRIRQSSPGRTWMDWDESLRAPCHTRATGARYGAVYGRMEWDLPAPTMTTLCYGFGNGRFGHPEQDRGISLREAAMLQTFPRSYKFIEKDARVKISVVGRLIGNAVPPKLGEIIGRTMMNHVARRGTHGAPPG